MSKIVPYACMILDNYIKTCSGSSLWSMSERRTWTTRTFFPFKKYFTQQNTQLVKRSNLVIIAKGIYIYHYPLKSTKHLFITFACKQKVFQITFQVFWKVSLFPSKIPRSLTFVSFKKGLRNIWNIFAFHIINNQSSHNLSLNRLQFVDQSCLEDTLLLTQRYSLTKTWMSSSSSMNDIDKISQRTMSAWLETMMSRDLLPNESVQTSFLKNRCNGCRARKSWTFQIVVTTNIQDDFPVGSDGVSTTKFRTTKWCNLPHLCNLRQWQVEIKTRDN